jgi:hypothetical protein
VSPKNDLQACELTIASIYFKSVVFPQIEMLIFNQPNLNFNRGSCLGREQHVLDTNAVKQLSKTATDV